MVLSKADIKDRIELLSKQHQIEVLRLLNNIPNIIMNENNNGVFINLTEHDDNVMIQLENFLNFVDIQQKHLNNIEDKQEQMEHDFFS
jgi:hypothetical protein